MQEGGFASCVVVDPFLASVLNLVADEEDCFSTTEETTVGPCTDRSRGKCVSPHIRTPRYDMLACFDCSPNMAM
jgi:hypothetical protein